MSPAASPPTMRTTGGPHRPLVVAAFLAALAAPAAAAEQAIIVLDASGSMWGQIDGTPKIAIARDALAGVVGNAPRDLSLGLMAYGHREKGSCGDIELLMMPAPGAAAEIEGMAKALNPKGKTPLSAAVRQAAEALKYTEQKATVILITDGLETCNADPCALASELESAGIDFTAHVVGFGLSAEEGQQVACIADRTGGTYLQAANAVGLTEALTSTVAEAAAPTPEAEPAPAPAVLPTATIAAPDTVAIGTQFTLTWDGPGEQLDHIWIVDPAARNGQGEAVRGRRLSTSPRFAARELALVAPTAPGTYELQYQYGRGRDVIGTRAIEVVAAEVSLDAPATADIGTRFVVDWVGPGGNRDAVELFDEAGGPGGRVVASARLANQDFKNRKVTLTAPTEPGFYLLRYRSGDDRTVLATRQIEVLAAEVGLTAPDAVDMGTAFDVTWIGPGANRDAVEIFDPLGGPDGKVIASKRLANGDYGKRSLNMTAPAAPGEYVLRYRNGDSRAVLATRPLTVVATAVAIDGPDAVGTEQSFKVTWQGPGASRDAIEIFDVAAGRVVASKRLVNDDYRNRTATLKAPKAPGGYLLRYWNGDSRAVLAERPLTVQ